ncbi:sensor histidine kinase [Spirillospora sp. CA-255316]
MTMTDGQARRGLPWERVRQRLHLLAPWLLLAPATVLSQLPPGLTSKDRAITLGLVALAACWVFFGHTRGRAEPRTAQLLVYFAGLLVLCALLMSRDTVFVLFTIAGFLHAFELRPWPLGVTGVFATSVTLNTAILDAPDAGVRSIGTYLGVIGIQTVAIGAGVVFTEKGIEHDRQRDLTVARLEEALEENAGLHAQLLAQARESGVLDERQRMAREIHDTLAQGLAGIITQVQAAQQVWHSPGRARPHLDHALDLARDGLAEARRSVQALGPRELEGAKLPDAVGDLAERWATGTDIDLHVNVTGDPVPLSPAIEVALFRVVQEALTNVGKHAQAARVGVTLSYLDDVVLLDVRDDGRGITGARHRGFGLSSMRQRIRGVGGTLEVESTLGEGTTISARVPAIIVAAP